MDAKHLQLSLISWMVVAPRRSISLVASACLGSIIYGWSRRPGIGAGGVVASRDVLSLPEASLPDVGACLQMPDAEPTSIFYKS